MPHKPWQPPRSTELHRGGHRAQRLRWLMHLTAAALLAAAGCRPALVGSGVPLSEFRQATSFASVHISGAVRVELQVSPGADPVVEISGDDNIVPEVITESSEGTLRIRMNTNGWIQQKTPLVARIVCSNLNELKVSGACDVTAEGLDGVGLDVDASGASKLNLEGHILELNLSVSGACSVDTTRIPAQVAALDVSGASSVRLRASDVLNGRASGACTVVLIGPCRLADLKTSGVAKLTRQESAPSAEAEEPAEEEGPVGNPTEKPAEEPDSPGAP